MRRTKTTTVGEHGETEEEFTFDKDPGLFGENLKPGDVARHEDGSVWRVAKVHGSIFTHQSGSGRPNYVHVDLILKS
jgi:hypothetical protein